MSDAIPAILSFIISVCLIVFIFYFAFLTLRKKAILVSFSKLFSPMVVMLILLLIFMSYFLFISFKILFLLPAILIIALLVVFLLWVTQKVFRYLWMVYNISEDDFRDVIDRSIKQSGLSYELKMGGIKIIKPEIDLKMMIVMNMGSLLCKPKEECMIELVNLQKNIRRNLLTVKPQPNYAVGALYCVIGAIFILWEIFSLFSF